jgi:hypothetical protein
MRSESLETIPKAAIGTSSSLLRSWWWRTRNAASAPIDYRCDFFNVVSSNRVAFRVAEDEGVVSFHTSRARTNSASPCFTFEPVSVIPSPLVKSMPHAVEKGLRAQVNVDGARAQFLYQQMGALGGAPGQLPKNGAPTQAMADH